MVHWNNVNLVGNPLKPAICESLGELPGNCTFFSDSLQTEEVCGKRRDRYRTTNATKWIAQAVVGWKNESVHQNSNVVDFSDEISRQPPSQTYPKSSEIVWINGESSVERFCSAKIIAPARETLYLCAIRSLIYFKVTLDRFWVAETILDGYQRRLKW